MKGTVKFFNDMKGFGFIAAEDGKEVFVHQSDLKEGVVLHENDSVTFEVEEGDRGPKATNVELTSSEGSSEEQPEEEIYINSLTLEENRVLFMVLAFRKTTFIKKLFKNIFQIDLSKCDLLMIDGHEYYRDYAGESDALVDFSGEDILDDPRIHEFPVILTSPENHRLVELVVDGLMDAGYADGEKEVNLVDEGQATKELKVLTKLFLEKSYSPGGIDYYKLAYSNRKMTLSNFSSSRICSTKFDKQTLCLIADNLGLAFDYKKTTKPLLCNKIMHKINKLNNLK